MIDFNKKLKGGLRKCPLHKFGAHYTFVKDDYIQCDKCKGFLNITEKINITKAYFNN